MTDRELLELAAKAAGIAHGADRLDCGLSLTLKDGRHESLPRWNPLDDDGDAFRLAVKLNLDVEPEDTFTMSACRFAGCHPRNIAKERAGTDLDADRFAAMRRAVVRVAAEIGRNKP